MTDAKDQNLTRVENSKAERQRRAGRAWEVLSVAALAAGAVLLWDAVRSSDGVLGLISVILIVVSVLSFLAAARSSSNADSEVARESKRSRYLISKHRIDTLKQVKAPEDVTNFLGTIENRYPLKQDQLLGELRMALGSERMSEVKNIVMKYTQIDRKHAAALLKEKRKFK